MSKDISAYFIDENKVSEKTKLSPSGRYELLIRYYKTKDGCWNYSRGTIYQVSDRKEICDVQRNYSTFHHSFITKNSQEWLITGKSYMSQTIINLDEGVTYEPPGDQYNGVAFCWAYTTISPDGNTLVVDGCHWACPYEYRFYDFSDPSKGWPALEVEEFLEAGETPPVFNEDGSITCFESREYFLPTNKCDIDISVEELEKISKEYEDKEENWGQVVTVKTTLRREGSQFKVIDRWISPEEQERIKKSRAAREKFDQWMVEFKKSDPLYLKFKELLKSPKLSPESYESHGQTYAGWCPDFKETETRWCKRILNKKDTQPYTIDLDWAVKTGPIKLTIFKDGKSHENKFFEHSVAGMLEAFALAEQLAAS